MSTSGMSRGMSAADHYTTAAHHVESAKLLHMELTRKPREGEVREADWQENREHQLDLHLRFAKVHAQLASARADGVQLAQLFSTGSPASIRAEAEAWAEVVTGVLTSALPRPSADE